ncbi:hypothetical protein C8A05DRAFT_38088 [Staphylotrichum tortipilum]|uniref:Glyoxalase/fosfomycin resistance/dioxygenase domain-containing protein n=1 Tax=Staphylotrichum tortipilum TaxID=2831512 RepID=A0AAN6RQ37_9PEZI|nr:hypothetical protein C8A05DRAFT_38088 [Staphylotrichum longicolle]
MASKSEECKDTTTTSSSFPLPGAICWLEVPCTSLPRAVAFYTAVLGWSSADPSSTPLGPGVLEGNAGLHMFTGGGGQLNGAFVVMSKPEGVAVVADEGDIAKMGVLPSYRVESVEETLGRVVENGGRVHVPKMAIAGGSMGYFARFIDTEGNLQGIWAAPAE